jgi:hypothetical protein
MNDRVNSKEVLRAFKMARFMKWIFPLTPFCVLLVAAIAALLKHSTMPILWGFMLAVFGGITVYFVGIQFCRCPKCGQHWWSPISLGMGWLSVMMYAEIGDDETESYRCRKCGLEIGPCLRNPNSEIES